ncbi:hypothetical protein [Streptomyces sp. bgisy100]|uniref:hypothetical protein n=1 Tax=Streptomyces sp. bgisy100 TaxID=3413783 RepID=UPI003D765EC1
MPKGKYAKSTEEAEADLIAYCASVGFDREWLSAKQWSTTIDIACDKAYGFEQAHKAIDSDQIEITSTAAREARQRKLSADADGLLAAVKQDKVLKATQIPKILELCADAYVGGQRVNLGLVAKPMSTTAYETLQGQWDKAAGFATGDGVFTNFQSFEPQDKAKAGKGNVGDTLDTRGVQGNLLVRIAGRTFNMHIDIAE